MLCVGGIPIDRLAERAGGTPFFAYDRQLVAQRIDRLRKALPPAIHLHFSLKANPMPALAGHLMPLVDGFDVASAGEMKVALDAGMPADRIGFAGPGKSDAELRQAVAAGVTIAIEATDEPERIAAAARAVGCRPRVMIRINPAFEVRAGGMRMGGGAKPFGIDEEQVPALAGRIAALDLDLAGFHLFWGSQSLDAARIAEAHNQATSTILTLSPKTGHATTQVTLGAGFGIPYGAGETPLDLDSAAAGVAGAAGELARQLPGTRLALEFGRFLVGEAGVYVCRVLDRKESRGEIFLVTDGGLHHHLAASGNFGQALKRNYPVAIADRLAEPAVERVNVVGRLCTPLDVLARQATLPPARPGDLVVIFQSGAYAATASPSGFLSHGPAVELLV
jgi:diaminopimelate decarboxylase